MKESETIGLGLAGVMFYSVNGTVKIWRDTG